MSNTKYTLPFPHTLPSPTRTEDGEWERVWQVAFSRMLSASDITRMEHLPMPEINHCRFKVESTSSGANVAVHIYTRLTPSDELVYLETFHIFRLLERVAGEILSIEGDPKETWALMKVSD